MKKVRKFTDVTEVLDMGENNDVLVECFLKIHHMGTVSLTLCGSKLEIPVKDVSLEGRLSDCVPPWGGGEYIYFDTATIIASITRSEDRVEVSSVVSGTIIRDGEGDYEF